MTSAVETPFMPCGATHPLAIEMDVGPCYLAEKHMASHVGVTRRGGHRVEWPRVDLLHEFAVDTYGDTMTCRNCHVMVHVDNKAITQMTCVAKRGN